MELKIGHMSLSNWKKLCKSREWNKYWFQIRLVSFLQKIQYMEYLQIWLTHSITKKYQYLKLMQKLLMIRILIFTLSLASWHVLSVLILQTNLVFWITQPT